MGEYIRSIKMEELENLRLTIKKRYTIVIIITSIVIAIFAVFKLLIVAPIIIMCAYIIAFGITSYLKTDYKKIFSMQKIKNAKM